MRAPRALSFIVLGIATSHVSLGFVPKLAVSRTSVEGCRETKMDPSRIFHGKAETRCYAAEVVDDLEAIAVPDLKERGLELLNDAIANNSAAATALLSEINTMRETGTDRETIEEFLNYLLSNGPDRKLPMWTRSTRLARFSRRARLASLCRMLELTTPPPSENDASESDDFQAQRRRRALLSVLRTLSNENASASNLPAIVAIERNARKAMQEDQSDLRSRLPEGLETPEYEVLTKRGANQGSVEIRRYKPFSLCAVSMNKPRPDDSSKTDAKLQMPEMGGASSFGALAGYLFGKNTQSTAMKMTTPVFTVPGNDADEKQMAFVLPSNYWDDETKAPQPLTGSGVTLQRVDAQERAVIMFGGYASKAEVETRKKQLVNALLKDKEWKMEDDELAVAQYNDPFTVPWRRLNEVSVSVVPK